MTPIAGTTRDLLREHLNLDGMPITVVDTAGLRESHDVVEIEGIRRATAEAGRADLLLWVMDASAPAIGRSSPGDSFATIPTIHVHNKIDLIDAAAHSETRADGVHVFLSARTGAGIDLLRQAVRVHAGLGEGSTGVFSARARHVDALERTQVELASARAQALDAGHGELAAEDLRRAHDSLGEVLGRFTSDALLGAIFSSFCIGK